jgi:hypothetical protein
MGSGANVQERLIALHHLDAPWRPADVEQREGRILRQGNQNPMIHIYRYVTAGSFDSYMWQTLETKARFIAQVMTGDMTLRRVEDLDSAALTYAEVKAIASGNPLVIEKAQVDAELVRLSRLRSAHAEEQYRIRGNLRHANDDASSSHERLGNLRQDITAREDMSGDKFRIEFDGQLLTNRGVAGELLIRRAEKMKNRVCEDVRVGRFAGFELFLRVNLGGDADLVLRGKNSYAARITDTALGTIRPLETTIQGFEERAAKLSTHIAEAHKRAQELKEKIGQPFEHDERHSFLTRRQSQIEEKLDLTKNQAPNEMDSSEIQSETQTPVEAQNPRNALRIKHRSAIRV